jgi:NADPH-dependent 7-cyano-7-deazaguanine reductase QueF
MTAQIESISKKWICITADVTENGGLTSKPTVTSAEVEAEIEEFINFVHSNRFMNQNKLVSNEI